MKQSQKTGHFPRVPYALTVFGEEERRAVADVLSTPMIVPGERVKVFEKKIAAMFGHKYGVMVNSGSSANLLALELLGLPKGAEVITPVLTFGTTIAPLLQKGLVPVFVDCIPGQYLVDIAEVERAITKKTKALMIPSLIGNVPNYKKLQRLAQKHHLFLIEDSCDTLGPTIGGKPTGTYTDISTTSFYASHIITAGGTGGMICFDRDDWYLRAKMLAGWGRSSAINESETASERFANTIDGVPYDGKFIFREIGYNFQSTEISAAFGLEQLKKFKRFWKTRDHAFRYLLRFFSQYEKYFILPVQDPSVSTAWLAFPLVVRDDAPFSRHEFVTFLEERNIQTRPIFTGNALKQPAFSDIPCRVSKKGYPGADLVMRGSVLLGCHHGMTEAMLKHLCASVKLFLE